MDPSVPEGGPGERRLDAGLAEAFGRREPAASPSVLARLWSAGTPVRRLLLREPPGSGPATVVRPRPGDVPPDEQGRYRIVGEIARGGIGVVLKGHDVDLGRDVAMKVLREEYADRPEVVERFVEEAQIGGQLQHPGIVPVYEIGLSADRRPFFAMKLVKGRTLAALLSERADVADGLRAHLATFESVCQTVGYAHARGVIHRDLKPANVMVGAFGEVQVVDWGLAKVLGQGGVHDERRARTAEQSVIDTVRSEGTGSASVVGSVIGTPRYMSPEQARGEVEGLDARADVFALGALLCEILTGAPPYRGEEHEVLAQAANADLDDARARLDACGADADLVALATECLAPAKRARPRDAGAVAARVGAYFASIAERARAAEIDAAESRVAAQEARRRSRVTMALVAAVAALLLAGVGFWAYAEHAGRERAETERARIGERQAREAEARAHADAARDRADAVEAKADEALREAQILRERALAAARPEDAVPLWHDAVAAAARAETAVASPDAAVTLRDRVVDAAKALREAKVRAVEEAASLQRDRQTAFRIHEASHANDSGMTPPEGEAHYGRLFREYGLDPDAGEAAWAPVLARSTIRKTLGYGIENWLKARERAGLAAGSVPALLAAVDSDPFNVRRRAARTVDELSPLAEEALVSKRPDRMIWVAVSFMDRGAFDRAAPLLDQAIALLPGEYNPHVLAARCAAYLKPPAWRVAVQHLGAALALVPRSETACATLAWVLTESDDAPAALDLTAGFLRAFPKDPNGYVRFWRANAFHVLGRFGDAEQEYRRVLETVPGWVEAHVDLARVLVSQGRLEEAERTLREALRRDPRSAQARKELGNLLRESGDLDGALAELRKALAELPRGVGTDRLEAAVHADLASVFVAKASFDDALVELDAALRLRPDFVTYHANRSAVLTALKRHEEALASSKEALRLKPRSAVGWNGLGVAYGALGDVERATGAFRQAAALDEAAALPTTNLASILRNVGDASGALAAAEEAVRRAPELASAHAELADARWDLDRRAEALESGRRAVELAPGDPVYRLRLADRLFRTGHFPEALELAEESVLRTSDGPPAEHAAALHRRVAHYAASESRLLSILSGKAKPKDAAERVDAAHVAHWNRMYVSAATQWAEALRGDPVLREERDARYDAACAAARAASGSGEEASRLDPATRGKWRRTALEWIRTTFDLMRKAPPAGGPSVSEQLHYWFKDPDFAGVRDPDAIATFPEAERADWWALWAEVRLAAGPWKPATGAPIGTSEELPREDR